MTKHLITLMVFLPVLGAILQALIPKAASRWGFSLSSWVTLGASLASSICGFILVLGMRPQADLQAIESIPWVGSFAISYEMGVDGLNALLVLLIVIIFPLLIASEWNQRLGAKGMHGLLLMLQASLAGAVCAQDLFLLFFLWSLSSIPFYFLIGIWGGPERESAAFRTLVSTAVGGALLFTAMILVYYSVDPNTFSLRELAQGQLGTKTFNFFGRQISSSNVAFVLIGVGLALRAPIWPFHGWFIQAAKQAPASVFVALSAVTVPVALYIFIRVTYSLFPSTVLTSSTTIVTVGLINLIVGGICAITQKSLKSLMAYICVGQIGLALVGVGSLNAAGVVGAVFQSLLLGLGLASFGMFTGVMISRVGKAEFLDEESRPSFGGLALRAPWLAAVAAVATASLLGLPGIGGFVGNALILIGSYSVHPAALLLAGLATLLATYYLFMMYRHVFLGRMGEGVSSFSDISVWERSYLFPIVLALLIFGIYPKPWLELVRPTVLTLLSTIK